MFVCGGGGSGGGGGGFLPVYPVYALALVQTGHAGAFINVDLAVSALEASHALTRVCSNVVTAGGAILTRTLLALVDFHLAVNPYTRQSRDGRGPRREIGGTPNYLSTVTDTTQEQLRMENSNTN